MNVSIMKQIERKVSDANHGYGKKNEEERGGGYQSLVQEV